MAGGEAVLFQVLLVVFLGAVERPRRRDCRDYGAGVYAGFLQLRQGVARRLFLGRRLMENHGAILRTNVGSLPVLLGRVVACPKRRSRGFRRTPAPGQRSRGPLRHVRCGRCRHLHRWGFAACRRNTPLPWPLRPAPVETPPPRPKSIPRRISPFPWLFPSPVLWSSGLHFPHAGRLSRLPEDCIPTVQSTQSRRATAYNICLVSLVHHLPAFQNIQSIQSHPEKHHLRRRYSRSWGTCACRGFLLP